MWTWAPTSNSVYGNFPANRKPSSTSVSGSNQQQQQQQNCYQANQATPSVQQPGFYGGSNHVASNNNVYQMPLPAGSYLPSSNQYNANNYYQGQQGVNPTNTHGNNCQIFPVGTFLNSTGNFQQGQQQVGNNLQSNNNCSAAGGGNDNNESYNYHQAPAQNLSGGDSNNNEATVEYLYGEEAEKVLRQLQASQQYQPMSTQAATSGVPSMSTNMENGSGEKAHVSNKADQSSEQTLSGGDSISQNQNYYYHTGQPQNPTQPQSQISTPCFEVSQPRPVAVVGNKKKGKVATTPAEEDYNRYFYTYETPPLVSPQPEAMPARVQSNTEQRPTGQGRRLSNKPTFHLCGRCTKCKMIQGESTKSPAPNAYTLPKPPVGPTQSIKNGPMGRQMSATVFQH